MKNLNSFQVLILKVKGPLPDIHTTLLHSSEITVVPLSPQRILGTRVYYWNWEEPCGAPGHKSPFVLQDSSHPDLPWAPKCIFKQLLIKGGAARKPPEARLRTERLLEIRTGPPEGQLRECRLCTHPSLTSTSPFNYCYKTPFQILPGWDP